MRNTSEIHIKLKSCLIIISKISCPIILWFCTEHSSGVTILTTKLQNDLRGWNRLRFFENLSLRWIAAGNIIYCNNARPWHCCNIGYPSETLHLKSKKISFAPYLSGPIISKFCTEHGSDTAVLCAKFRNDWAQVMVLYELFWDLSLRWDLDGYMYCHDPLVCGDWHGQNANQTAISGG